jgi:hypothetical protein
MVITGELPDSPGPPPEDPAAGMMATATKRQSATRRKDPIFTTIHQIVFFIWHR